MENIKERALDAIASYEKTKSDIRKEVRKEFARELHGFEQERVRREKIVKDKMMEIDSLEAKIQSLNNTIYGLRSKSKLWEHECARISEAYCKTIAYYSNPGLVEVQLQVILEYADALIRFVACHRWDRDTVYMAQRYRDSINEKINRIVHQIDANLADDTSVASVQKNTETGSKE